MPVGNVSSIGGMVMMMAYAILYVHWILFVKSMQLTWEGSVVAFQKLRIWNKNREWRLIDLSPHTLNTK